MQRESGVSLPMSSMVVPWLQVTHAPVVSLLFPPAYWLAFFQFLSCLQDNTNTLAITFFFQTPERARGKWPAGSSYCILLKIAPPPHTQRLVFISHYPASF